MDKTEMILFELDYLQPIHEAIRFARFRMSDSIINGMGHSEWIDLLHEIVGRFITDPLKTASKIDVFYQELSDQYPYLLDPEIINEEDQLYTMLEIERKYRSLKIQLKEELKCQVS